METVQALTTLFPLAVSSGINLYATVLIVGLSMRYGLVSGVPDMFDVLASWPVILLAGLLYIVEFFADKLPLFDHVWDVLHTFVRPFGAAVIAFSAIAEVDPSLSVVAALVSGGVALVSHSGKAGGRVALNTMSPAENVSNIGVSLAEDVLVGVLAVLALKFPLVATVVAACVMLLVVVFVPPLVRWSWFNLVAVTARVKGLVRPLEQSETLPTNYADLVQGEPLLVVRCRANHIKGASGRSGYLALTRSTLYFTYAGWVQITAWQLDVHNVDDVSLHRRVLMDVVRVQYHAGSKPDQTVQFVCMKDRSLLVQELVRRLHSFHM